jgi:hypothetical protein
MKKQLIACALALLSVSSQGLLASGSPRFTNPFGQLNLMRRFPVHMMDYTTFQDTCVNAPWIAKNPAVQKFVQNNFGIITGGTAAALFAVVMAYAGRTVYRWWNDRKVAPQINRNENDRIFDAQFENDSAFRETHLVTAAENAANSIANDPNLANNVAIIWQLFLSGRTEAAGMLSVFNSGSDPRCPLMLTLRDHIRNCTISTSLNFIVENGAYTSPLKLFQDSQLRAVLIDAMARQLALQEKNTTVDGLTTFKCPVIRISDEPSAQIDTNNSSQNLLCFFNKLTPCWPPMTSGKLDIQKVLGQLPANSLVAVINDGQFVGCVETKLTKSSDRLIDGQLNNVNCVDYTYEVLDNAPRNGTVKIYVDLLTAIADWHMIRDLPFEHSGQLHFMKNADRYVPGQPLNFCLSGARVQVTHQNGDATEQVFPAGSSQPGSSNGAGPQLMLTSRTQE